MIGEDLRYNMKARNLTKEAKLIFHAYYFP